MWQNLTPVLSRLLPPALSNQMRQSVCMSCLCVSSADASFGRRGTWPCVVRCPRIKSSHSLGTCTSCPLAHTSQVSVCFTKNALFFEVITFCFVFLSLSADFFVSPNLRIGSTSPPRGTQNITADPARPGRSQARRDDRETPPTACKATDRGATRPTTQQRERVSFRGGKATSLI